jgi:hypothetical protein
LKKKDKNKPKEKIKKGQVRSPEEEKRKRNK